MLPNAGSTSYEDTLAVLALHLVLVRPVFQLNDRDMIPLLPLFFMHFEYSNMKECIGVVFGSWGGRGGPVGPQLAPIPLPSKMTPECERIDGKYAQCLYHTRIGLNKWMHDTTL